jgi:hypothetical protein
MKTEIKVNDKVKIINDNYLYTTYELIFRELGFKNKLVNYKPDNYKDLVFDVVAITEHKIENRDLYFIKSNDVELLISKQGIEKIDNPNIDLSKLTPELINELSRDENVKQILINNRVIKNELEVGKWYKFQEKTADWWLGCIADSDLKYYGFNSGKWFNKTKVSLINQKYQSYTLATPQEVETALKNEAVKKYKGVTKIDNTKVCFIGSKYDIELNDFEFFADRNMLTCGKNKVVLFLKGVWAEPIKEETYIKVPLSIITLTDSKKKLGRLVKNLAKNV